MGGWLRPVAKISSLTVMSEISRILRLVKWERASEKLKSPATQIFVSRIDARQLAPLTHEYLGDYVTKWLTYVIDLSFSDLKWEVIHKLQC